MKSKQFQRTKEGNLILLTPEDKDILITDLTARLKYGVICMIERVDDFGDRWRNEKLTGFYYTTNHGIITDLTFDFDGLSVDFAEKVMPYLRPMSSMTEEEKSRYEEISMNSFDGVWHSTANPIDYLNSIHIDHRGLIEKELALEAPKDMYLNKEQHGLSIL